MKSYALVLALVSTVALAACSDSPATAPSTPPSTTASTPPSTPTTGTVRFFREPRGCETWFSDQYPLDFTFKVDSTVYGTATLLIGQSAFLSVPAGWHNFEWWPGNTSWGYMANGGMVTPGDTLVFALVCR